MLTSASGTQPSPSTSALIRNGEYRRISGAIVTEYADHVTAVTTATRSPSTFPETPPPATKPTPTNATSAASQKPDCIRSRPTAAAINAVKTGVAPSTSATVDALVLSIATTKLTWFTKSRRPASVNSCQSA